MYPGVSLDAPAKLAWATCVGYRLPMTAPNLAGTDYQPAGRVLVTGGAGFIGANLCRALLAMGEQVVVLDDLSHGFRRNIEELLPHERFEFVIGDVRDRAAVLEAAEGANLIVHLAAGKIPRYGSALETLQVNARGGEHVLDAARETGARLVHASTSDVYGMSPDLPFREDGNLVLGTSHVRRWAYAVSKLYDEHLAQAYREEYEIEAVSLRFFGSYGEFQNTTWWGGPQSVFIHRALRDMPLELHGDGRQTRSFTYVGDTVAGVMGAMYTPEADGEILNIGGDHEITIHDLACKVWDIVRPGEPPRLECIPYSTFGKYQDVRRRVPDTSRAHELFGFDAKVGLDEGLRRAVAWQAGVEGIDWPGAPSVDPA